MRRAALAVATAVLAAAVAIGAHEANLLRPLERTTYDARFAVRGDQPPPADTVIVAIDEDSIARLPRFPFPRRLYADLIDRLDAAGARLIVFNIAFDRPRSGDGRLRASARRAQPVVFGTPLIDEDGDTLVLGGPEAQREIGARVGATLVPPDPDNRLRRLEPDIKGLPILAVATAGLLEARVPEAADYAGGAPIDFAGPADTFPAIGMHEVLGDALRREDVAGKVVLVGATAPVLQDFHSTPRGRMSGVEVQANALRTVRAGLPLHRTGLGWTAVAALALALVAPLASLRLRPIPVVAAALGASLAWLAAAQVAFGEGRIVDVTTPLLAGLLATVAVVVGGYARAARERERLREQFAAYEATVVADVLAGHNPALAPTGVVSGYRIEELVGRGGMAVVYRAVQLALERTVALKLIDPQHGRDERFRERFLRESRMAALVEHPHVIPIYDAGDDDGLLYLAMRYVDGVDLADVIRSLGPPQPAVTVRIVGQIAGALDAAHAAGLVHRDVKPANILLAGELEHAFLTDFGIARDATSSGLTATGAFVGTPDYTPPEQMAGAELDGRVDVYALGCVLYETLTGHKPFPRPSMLAVLQAHAQAPPPRPSQVDPALAPFDAVVARAMAKDRDERYASAGELARDAEAALVSRAR